MQIYLVGGAVRDTLLGLPVKDRDWVVVGATPQQLLAQGYTPVGRDFPVFLHPRTHEQYALARTERKTAPGYLGFAVHAAPDVTLEQDLARRDLTINAMAVDAAQTDSEGNFDPARATVVDPYGGRADLAARRLRHVTDAFREDPVRILRVARFAARFADFSVAPDTLALMQAMVANDEVGALVAERVWQELSRGLMEERPSRMFAVLQACGALSVVLPELAEWQAEPPGSLTDRQSPSSILLRVLDHSACLHAPLQVRFACISLCAHPSDDAELLRGANPILRMCARLRTPSDVTSLAELAAREGVALQSCNTLDAEGLVQLLERCDAFRRPARMGELMQVIECDAVASGSVFADIFRARDTLQHALAAAQTVPAGLVAKAAAAGGLVGAALGQHIHARRVDAVAKALKGRAPPLGD